jgi:hypothetical protein
MTVVSALLLPARAESESGIGGIGHRLGEDPENLSRRNRKNNSTRMIPEDLHRLDEAGLLMGDLAAGVVW